MVRRHALTLVILGLLYPGMATALGLGELTLHSFLNEPLDAEVDLLETQGLDTGQIRIRLATREDFKRAGVERKYFLTNLKFEIEGAEGEVARLRIISTQRVREPFLDFLIEVRWPNGRILREYTVLLDPPVLSGPGTGMTATAAAPRDAVPAGAAPDYATRADTVESSDTWTGAVEGEDEAGTREFSASRYGNDAGPIAEPGAKYMVERDDTLWSIASRSRPGTASVQQTMLDILRLNSEAFVGNNINQLKAGYVLRLPTTAELSDIAPDEVAALIAEQDRNWRDGVASAELYRVDASEQAGSSGVAGSDGGDEGQLQISGVEDGGSDSGFEGDLSARLENRDSVLRDNEDLQGRLDSMDQQVAMLKRLVTLKDDQIAALQDALAEAGETPEITAVDGEDGIIDAGVDEPPAEPGVIDVDVDVDAGEVVETPVPPVPTPAPVEPDLVEQLKGYVAQAMDYAVYIGAGLLLVVLAIVWMLRGRVNMQLPGRVGKPVQAGAGGDADDEFAGVELIADDAMIIDEFAGDFAAESEGDEPLTSFSAPDEEAYAAQFETGDALAEADIYIAYGRFPQAVDLLKAAIGMEPVNTEYRVKLMEACVEMVDSGEFQQQYADLQVIGEEAALQLARAMLDAVDGGEVWLDDLPEPSLTEEDVVAAGAVAVAAAAVEASDSSAAELEAAEPGSKEPADEILDLDLDLGSLDDEVLELDLGAGALEDLPTEDSGDLDLDLDLDLDAEEDEPEGLQLMDLDAEPWKSDTDDELSAEPVEEVEFESDLELELIDEASAADESDGEIDLKQLSMDDLQTEPAQAADPVADDELEEIELADFSRGEPDSGDEPVAEASLEVKEVTGFDLDALGEFGEDEAIAGAELEESGDALVFAADGDEIATKLDLARAYMDMGDHEGTRNILEEVLQDGSDSQKQEAQSLLDSID